MDFLFVIHCMIVTTSDHVSDSQCFKQDNKLLTECHEFLPRDAL